MEESEQASRAGLAVAIAAMLGVVLLLATLLDIGPCADDELSAEEFVAQGDELCAEAHDEFLELQNSAPRTPTDAAELVGGLIDVAEEERDAIADLREPPELTAQVARYLELRDRGIELLREGRAAAEEADPVAYERIQAELAATQLDPRYEIAGEIGFEQCSKPLVEREELARQAEAPAPTDLSAPPEVDNPPASGP